MGSDVHDCKIRQSLKSLEFAHLDTKEMERSPFDSLTLLYFAFLLCVLVTRDKVTSLTDLD